MRVLLVDTEAEGEGGSNGERSMETYTLPYVKQIASRSLMCDAGSSDWCPGTTYSGGMGWEGGSRGRRRMDAYGWFMLMYGRNQHNIVKQLSSK